MNTPDEIAGLTDDLLKFRVAFFAVICASSKKDSDGGKAFSATLDRLCDEFKRRGLNG
jgi:hypothetical protein